MDSAKCGLNPLDSSVCFADPKSTVPCSILCGGGTSEARLAAIQTAVKSAPKPESK